MPMPTPSDTESQDDFIGRCMANDVMSSDYPDAKQRTAVCHAQWDKKSFAKLYDMEAEVFAVGKWNGLEFTLEDLMGIAHAFSSLGDNHRVPLKFGHNDKQPMTDGQPSLGWVSDVWVNRDTEKLMVRFTDMPAVVYNAIGAKLYRNVSIELDMGVSHKGTYYPWVLSAVALLGADIPAVNTLADLQAYMTRESFTLEKVETVHFSVSSVNFNKEESIMADDKVTVDNLNATIRALNVQIEKDAHDRVEFERRIADLEAKLKAKEEVDLHRKQAEQRSELFGKLEKMVGDKKITPAMRDEFERDFDNATKEHERGQVIFAVNKLEKTIESNPEYFGAEQARRKAETDRLEADKAPDQIVLARTREYMAKHGEKNFSIAKNAVLRADQELANKYARMEG